MDALITKRLHISGLTPALSVDDIKQRFSSFGTVLSLEGFGLPDGVGQPRKFGYVTFETTSSKLAKCLNLLSGSTWKGAKLRIGEAKPDYAQRLAKEREENPEDSPRKRRKRTHGVYAQDMSLVTPENVPERLGWKVTPLGRILRPVKMRPGHPLPLPIDTHQGSSKNTDAKSTPRKRKRERLPDSRARRRTIDMTRWGSTHLTGIFLGASESVGLPPVVAPRAIHQVSERHGSRAPAFQAPSSLPPSPPTERQTDAPPHAESTVVDFVAEKSKTLDLLSSMFGDTESEWIGKESLDSDIEEGLLKETNVTPGGEDLVTYEEVPQENVNARPRKLPNAEPTQQDHVETTNNPAVEPPPAKPKPSTKLKDLFAPTEAAGFSLVGHLDLDLELDDELPYSFEEQPSQPQQVSSITPPTAILASQAPIHIDNKQALFFPHPPDSQSNTKARLKDVFDIAKDNGWYWRDPNVGFYRTGTEEDIRKHWEEVKVDLTKGWKKRWREAGKMSRRRKGGAGDEAV